MMKTLPLMIAALALTGCTGAFVGNIFVVFVAVGIFFGTLGLGRNAGPGSSSASRPDSTTDGRS
jgi:hypothetical protein